MVDIEDTRHLYEPQANWYFMMATKLVGSYANVIFMTNNFALTPAKALTALLVVIVGLCCIMIGFYDLEYFMNVKVFAFIMKFMSVYFLGLFQMYVHKNITSEIIDSMIGRIEEQSKFEQIVKHL